MSIREKIREHRERHGPREDVLPCPECGSDRTWTTGQFRPIGLLVKCNACGFRGPLGQSREIAISLWNNLDRDRSE